MQPPPLGLKMTDHSRSVDVYGESHEHFPYICLLSSFFYYAQYFYLIRAKLVHDMLP